MKFIKAEHADLPRIVEIYNQIIPSRLATADLKPVSVEDREEWFNSFTETHPIFKIMDGDKMLGWVALDPFYGRPAYEHTAEISIYIDQNVRNRGVGQKAIEFVESKVNELEITAIVAYIFGHNKPSLGLFEKFGFKEWGRLPQVAELDEVKRDLVVMGKRYDG